MKVAIFGLGYVGTVTAACLATHGHDVWGVDVDTSKVALVNGGQSTVVEPGLSELVDSCVQSGRLHATTDIAEATARADISLICVGTPSSSQGSADLRYVQAAITGIVRSLIEVDPPESGVHHIIIRSTVPPGTVDHAVAEALASMDAGALKVEVLGGMCPEFLREGTGIADFYAPPFLVVGTKDPRLSAAVSTLFAFLDEPVRTVSTRTAEALKYTCNAFHATKVSFANEIARLFNRADVDSREVMELFCEDTRLNISTTYLRPGFAFGGSCLPKDLRSMLYMARMNGTDLPLLSGTLATNDLCIREVVDRLIDSDVKVVALFGLSFKMSSDDLRESPYVELAERLIGKGFEVRIFDPIVNPMRLVGANRTYIQSKLPHLCGLMIDDPVAMLEGADVAIVSSSDPDVLDALRRAQPPSVIDLNGRLGEDIEALAGYAGVSW